MIYTWEEKDIREGRMVFLRKNDTHKVMIGRLEHPDSPCRPFVLINGASVSVPYSASDMCFMFNGNSSHPDDLYR